MSIAEIVEKWKSGIKQVDIAKELDVSEAYISQVLAPFKKPKYKVSVNAYSPDYTPSQYSSSIKQYPDIIYIALEHYKRTWFKNKKPQSKGKMLREWKQMEAILETEM